MLGDTLGHYRLIEKIGSGGMGEVYRAHDEHLDRDVALKVLPAGTVADEAARKQFRKEAVAIAKLNHPNIATVHEFNCQNGVDFLAMELILGRSLREILKEVPLQVKEIRRLGLQLVEALASAHEHGVVHRDLKSANIMITHDGRLKILDFGLAKLVQSIGGNVTQSSTGTGSAAGTVPYMAPEQLRGEASDTRADVYAAGAVLYEMATGQRAFAENNWPQLIDSILHKTPQPPCDLNARIPADMQATILKALEKDPRKRHQSARELLLELEALSPAGQDPSFAVSVEQSQVPPLEIAHVLFMDIVAYSMLPMEQQRLRLRELQKTVRETSEFIRAKDSDQLISLPTGDGMALVFFGDSEFPVRCALELSRALRDNPRIRLRMGIHTGPVYRVPDINAARNVSGGGINMAQRVMDCGDAGHILLSKTVVDVLGQLSRWEGSLHDLGEAEVKHGVRVHLFNFYVDDAGNPELPTKLAKAGGLPKSVAGSRKRVRSSHPEPNTPQRPKTAQRIRALAGSPADSTQARTVQIGIPHVSRLGLFATGGCLLLLIATAFVVPTTRDWVLQLFLDRSSPPVGVPAVEDGKFLAVLPFSVQGDPDAFGYISEGLDEELSRKISALRTVQVVSSKDAKEAAAKAGVDLKGPPDMIARGLGVNLIVQGTVVVAGGWVHITVNLEDVADRKSLWRHHFSSAVANLNLLTLEDQIYGPIVRALKLKPTGDEQGRAAGPTDNIEAYDLYLKGLNALRVGRDSQGVKTSMELFQNALRQDPRFALAYVGLAEASNSMLEETKDASWAQQELENAQRAQKLNDNSPEVHLVLGTAYRQMGDIKDAIAEFERAKQLAPNSDEPWRRLGEVYGATAQVELAIDAHRKATLIKPYSLLNQIELGQAYFEFGQWDQALATFQHVITLDPDNFMGYLNSGTVYFEQGKYADCIRMVQIALKLNPNADVYSTLASAYAFEKRYSEAVKMFENAVALRPDDEQIVGNLADAYRLSGQTERARTTYRKAISLADKELEADPRDALVLGDLATYYAKIGEATLANNYIKDALSINSSNPVLFYEQAVIWECVNKPAQAVRSMQLALDHGFRRERAIADPDLAKLHGNPDFEKLLELPGKTN